MNRTQSSNSGSSARYGVPTAYGPTASLSSPLARPCIARTRLVTRSASAREPKVIVSMTWAVRASRS